MDPILNAFRQKACDPLNEVHVVVVHVPVLGSPLLERTDLVQDRLQGLGHALCSKRVRSDFLDRHPARLARLKRVPCHGKVEGSASTGDRIVLVQDGTRRLEPKWLRDGFLDLCSR